MRPQAAEFEHSDMAEVLLEYPTPVRAADRRVYRARACGSPAQDGTARWHGWIEFLAVEGGEPIRTGRETTQRNRADALYWATGLAPVYLRGALDRALNVNPLSLFGEGAPRLREHLGTLSRRRLVQIFKEYSLKDQDVENPQRLSGSELIEDIIAAIRTRLNPPVGSPSKGDKTHIDLVEHLMGGVSVVDNRTSSVDEQQRNGTTVEKSRSEKPPKIKSKEGDD